MKRIIFSNRLIKKENLSQKDIDIIIKSSQKNIFTKIKGDDLPKETSLIKIYVTTINEAKRLVFLLDEETSVGHFLFFRKKEDLLGKNISIKNPKFKEALRQYLKIWDEDMKNDNFEIIELV